MFSIEAPAGIVGIWDAARSPQAKTGPLDLFVTDLRERSGRGEIFFIEAEDPVTYRFEIVANEEFPPGIADEFEPSGGAFRLQAPTGDIRVGSQPEPTEDQQIAVPPGEYLVRAYARRPKDPARYDRTMTLLVGEADWRLHRRVTGIGVLGCFSFVAAAILLAIPLTRQFWWAALLMFVAPWVTYFINTRLPRYQRVEKLIAAYEHRLPHFVIVLEASAAAAELPGGWVPGP